MILNSWGVGLLMGQGVILLINGVAFLNALKILRTWDITAQTPEQLCLEHRSELIATVVAWSLGFQILSLLVFELSARTMAPLIPGAMCTVGTLTAHPAGWPLLFIKISGIYLYGFWVIVNHVDMQVESFPLTRFKSAMLLILFPLMAVEFFLTVRFFTGLSPAVITSCCGVIFEVGGQGFGSSVASLPPRLMRVALLVFLVVLIAFGYVFNCRKSVWGRLVYSAGSAAGLVIATMGIVAFVAPYIYLMPALHCPFIFLDQEHWHYGYLVYVPLFAASFLGVSAGILTWISRGYPKAQPTAAALGEKCVIQAQRLWIAFLFTAYAPVVKFWVALGVKADLFQNVY